MVKLTEVEVGRDVVVRSVRSSDTGLGTRLEHIGFLPGTPVRVERRAPLGDPTVYELRGFRVAVRRESAELVDVDDAHSEQTQTVDVTSTGGDNRAAAKAQAIEEARK